MIVSWMMCAGPTWTHQFLRVYRATVSWVLCAGPAWTNQSMWLLHLPCGPHSGCHRSHHGFPSTRCSSHVPDVETVHVSPSLPGCEDGREGRIEGKAGHREGKWRGRMGYREDWAGNKPSGAHWDRSCDKLVIESWPNLSSKGHPHISLVPP
jgi:hypothetical protein